MSILPYKILPRRMHCMFWLNAVPAKSGMSECFSPREIVIRQKVDYVKHCKVGFRVHCKVYNEPTLSNNFTPRTHHLICMEPTGNLQGTYKFFCLDTGRTLKRRVFKELYMPASVIRKVESWEKG